VTTQGHTGRTDTVLSGGRDATRTLHDLSRGAGLLPDPQPVHLPAGPRPRLALLRDVRPAPGRRLLVSVMKSFIEACLFWGVISVVTLRAVVRALEDGIGLWVVWKVNHAQG
jgi:hypothetical protein